MKKSKPTFPLLLRSARHPSTLMVGLCLLCGLAAFGGCVEIASAQPQKSYLNQDTGGLPPFFASMEKHEVMVQVLIKESPAADPQPAPADLKVGFRIMAQGSKVRDYKEKTDAKGRAFFLGIPSNPKVQGMITYEAWVDYKGIRFPFEVSGIPKTVNKDALYEDFNPDVRLPENQLILTVSPASSDIAGLTMRYELVELHPDEESLLAIQELILSNPTDRVIDLSMQPQGGLKLPAPIGAKSLELHQSHHDEMEVRGISVYFTGALLPHSEKKLKWYATIPYRAKEFVWSQSMPLPATVGMVVAPQYKKAQHQSLIELTLSSEEGRGNVRQVSTGPGLIFDALRNVPDLKAGEAFLFTIGGLPAPPLWHKQALIITSCLVALLVLLIGFRGEKASLGVSQSHLLIERDRLLKALARMEAALERKRITPARYQREREAITARLVTIYRALEELERNAHQRAEGSLT